MQAYAEGWELLRAVDEVDNVTEVFRSWREGTVIRSWLLDLLVAALDDDDKLDQIAGYAEDSGEGRWTVEAGIDNAVATPAITAALYARFVSRQDDSPAMKAVAAMRNQFGGHATKTSARRPAATRPERALRPARLPRSPVHVSHLSLARLPLLPRGRGRARAGGDGVRRPQRPGQDQPGRGGRLRRPAGLAPGRRRRPPGPARRRPRGRPGRGGPRRAGGAARGADQPGQVQPGPGQPVARSPGPASCSGWCGRCCSPPRTWRWSRATRRSAATSSTTCWCSGHPGSPGCAPTTTGCSSSATPCSRPPGAARRQGRSARVRAVHARRLGLPPGAHRRRAARRAAGPGRGPAALRRRQLRGGRRGSRPHRRDDDVQAARSSCPPPTHRPPTDLDRTPAGRCWPRSSGAATRRSTAASAWSARTATTSR